MHVSEEKWGMIQDTKVSVSSVNIKDSTGFFAAEIYVITTGMFRYALKGPKHDQIVCGFFYINPSSMDR